MAAGSCWVAHTGSWATMMAKRCLVQALRFNPANPDATRELRRLEGGAPGGGKKKGFFGKLFGGKKK